MMLRVGLTGGIACGKTTVAAMLRELGCDVIEADKLAHELTEPGQPAHEEIVREFGRQVLGSDGRIDRKKLGDIVFNDARSLERLNRIVHPRVVKELERRRRNVGPAKGVSVVEAALLIEAGYHEGLDRLVVVWCRPEQQGERLRARGLTDEQIDRRIAAQMPLGKKRQLADDEIDCSGTREQTRRQVEALVVRLRQLAAARTGSAAS